MSSFRILDIIQTKCLKKCQQKKDRNFLDITYSRIHITNSNCNSVIIINVSCDSARSLVSEVRHHFVYIQFSTDIKYILSFCKHFTIEKNILDKTNALTSNK